MNLKDPFGRMELRHENGYKSMRETMEDRGVDTPEKALELIKQSKKRALNFIVGGLAPVLVIILLLPKTAPLAAGCALFWVVWAVTSTINGQRYIRRYIDEELQHNSRE